MAKRSPLINAFKLFQGNKLYRELYMLPTNGMQHSIMTTTAHMQDDIDGDSAGCPYNGHQEESSSHDTKAKQVLEQASTLIKEKQPEQHKIFEVQNQKAVEAPIEPEATDSLAALSKKSQIKELRKQLLKKIEEQIEKIKQFREEQLQQKTPLQIEDHIEVMDSQSKEQKGADDVKITSIFKRKRLPSTSLTNQVPPKVQKRVENQVVPSSQDKTYIKLPVVRKPQYNKQFDPAQKLSILKENNPFIVRQPGSQNPHVLKHLLERAQPSSSKRLEKEKQKDKIN